MRDAGLQTLPRASAICSSGVSSDEVVFPSWGRSASMRQLLASAQRVARTSTPVLLIGEVGAGKDWLAHVIHQQSCRSGTVWPLSCRDLSEEQFVRLLSLRLDLALLETPKSIPIPPGSTLLLQEIEQLPPESQRRLVSIMDELEPPGSASAPHARFRILATTRADLSSLARNGRFSMSLFYRFLGVTLRVAPLRERTEDVEGLVAILLSELEQKYDLGPFAVSDDLLDAFRAAPWPGNVRQLRAILEQAILLSPGELLERRSLPDGWEESTEPRKLELSIGSSLAEVEKRLILETLRSVGGHRSRASRILGISRRKLHYRLRQYREEGLTA